MAQDQPADASQLKFRVEKHLRDQLALAAEANGVSLNKEIVERLTRSLEEKPVDFDPAKPAYGILMLLSRVMDMAGNGALFLKTLMPVESNWVDDDFAYANAVAAAVEVLNALKPASPKSPAKAATASHLDGVFVAERMLRMVASGQANIPEAQARLDSLRQSLGRLTDRIQAFATIDPDARALARLRGRAK